MRQRHIVLVITSVFILTACASVPNGPSAMALPGTGKSYSQFRADDQLCRGVAQSQLDGKTPREAASESFVNTAVLGTVIGAAIGAATGNGHGAGVGAATGLAFGSVAGANQSQWSADEAQDRYDNGYIQCMYANGERVPVAQSFANRATRSYDAPPDDGYSPTYYPPPPPPGYRR